MRLFRRKESTENKAKRQQIRMRRLEALSVRPDSDTAVKFSCGNGDNPRLLLRSGYLVKDGLHQPQSKH